MYNKLAVEVNEESSYVFIPSNGQWWFVFADDKISQSDTYTMSLLGVKASRCQRGSGAQHSSSASLMGGIKLLVDLHWLTWLMERVFTGLICMVLRWVFSGSSVNHVFFLFVSWVPAFGAVGTVGGWDRVDRGALFAGGMGRMGRVREAGSRLASVVVKLHQAEYQVWGHQLKRIWWIGYDIPFGTLALWV